MIAANFEVRQHPLTTSPELHSKRAQPWASLPLLPVLETVAMPLLQLATAERPSPQAMLHACESAAEFFFENSSKVKATVPRCGNARESTKETTSFILCETKASIDRW
jgi:hypothetical protein